MQTAQNNDKNSLYKDSPSKAEKLQELSELLDELYVLKAKLKDGGR